MAELSKLQLRARVLSVVSRIKTTSSYDESFLKELLIELEDIADKKTLFSIFVKEYIKMSDDESVFVSCLLKDLVDAEYIQSVVFDLLKSSNYSDEAKYKLVQLLRVANCEFDYNEAPEYFENPSDVIDSDTKRLLEKAIFNPEAMLDFLDFVSAVAEQDRNLLLNSLQSDYKGDMLANIVYPILYSDFDNKFKLKAIEILTEAKSSLALAPFNYLLETSIDSEIISACSVGLKKLKLAGATPQRAEQYFKNIISDTIPALFYTTIPDGNGNQAFIISRVNTSNDKYMLSAVVVNDLYGIEDCFGFYDISKDEILRIINKFYKVEGKYSVSAQYVKTRINEAVNLTIKNKRNFPYEFICWDTLLKDISPYEQSLLSFVLNSVSPQNLSKDKMLDFLTKEYSFRWYIKPAENKVLSDVLNTIAEMTELDINTINNLLLSNENLIFDEDTMQRWKQRIIQCIYLLNCNDNVADASAFLSIIDSEENMHIFRMVILQRSVFNYFFSVRETARESVLTANIFRKKQLQKEKIDIKKIESILDYLSKKWVYG